MAKSKAVARRPDVEVLPVEPDEQQLVKEVNAAIAGFVRGVVAFFREAKAIEKKSVATLMGARTLKPPTDAASDTVIQKYIQRIGDEEKAAENHWHPITSVVWNFHRWLTGKRKPTLDNLADAKTIAQPLHNAWVDSERRRVAKKAEDDRLAAERKAQADRDAELLRLETAALKAEESSPNLSAREQTFVDYYASSGKRPVGSDRAMLAAKTAGYKDPLAAGARLIASKKIADAVKAKLLADGIRDQAAAVKEQPLDTVEVVEEKMQVGTAGYDRTSWSGEVLDADATIEAFRNGKHGIPGDLFQINPVKLNEYARSLQKRLDLWPGVRAKKSTSTI